MVINGKNYEVEEQRLNELLDHLQINPNNVVVELNGEIIEKMKFENLLVNNQDKLEIVTFVGGG